MRLFTILLVAVAVGVVGCAVHRDGSSPAASIAAAPDASLQGVWRGTVTGRDFATLSGLVQESATLTITPDGQWTLVERQGGSEQRSSGTTRVVGSRVILDGHVQNGLSRGARVTHYFTPGPRDGLYGAGETFFLGHRVVGDFTLRHQTG
jgi:hypothetical protein